MPTASKAVAALCLAALGYLASEMFKTLMPASTYFGNFSIYNAIIGAFVGWIIVGTRAGRGTKDAIANGLTGVAALIFWCVFVHACLEMFNLSMKRRYDGPVEAFSAIFEIGIEYAGLLMNPMMISTLLIGALLTGYFSEYAARNWK